MATDDVRSRCDGKNCREFTGTLTKLDWQSPHAYFYLDIKDAGGKVENWSFQTYALITDLEELQKLRELELKQGK